MSKRISYYDDYITPAFFQYLKPQIKPVSQVPGLSEVGSGGGLESREAFKFLCELYSILKPELQKVLTQRKVDREFIDQRTKACFELNQSLKIHFLDSAYQTVLGQEDAKGRIVVGPKNEHYCKAGNSAPVSPVPTYLQGPHVTLFGPPDDAKLSINAMNAFHRKLKDEPAIVSELLSKTSIAPKWGADDEDSKTPLRRDLIAAGANLTGCFDGDLSFSDPRSKKSYQLEKTKRSHPIKRFPGLALPCSFLFYQNEPIPLHLYDFALHLFKNWRHPEALCFYVPKIENEEEAAYIRILMETSEKLMQKLRPTYKVGSIRLLIVLENPRAIFRVNEIMDQLHPYFAGASLGWHDYLASTARLFKEDGNYRIPVKADPNIVIKYIKASHDLLSEVVGSRGGIKIGGMYGVLPMDNDLRSPSFQITIKGFIKDVVTQMKRNLSGFWVAHPDFVRLGIAMVEAWKLNREGDGSKLDDLVKALLDAKDHAEILNFIHGPDLVGLSTQNPLYPRSLLVADIAESNFIRNNDPEEIRYNVFQSLQYLTDWLSGNGCVALPAQIQGVPVRVMDDLATAERSRWEVWHEIKHGRFPLEAFLKIAHEEMLFIRKDRSNDQKIVQVKWETRTEKWYPVAFNLMLKLMTDPNPVEFATELLMPFTIDSIREAADPWALVQEIDSKKFHVDPYLARFNEIFNACGNLKFAATLAKNVVLDLGQAEELIQSFSRADIIEAAAFHGDIGESRRTLDSVASREQAFVLQENEQSKENFRERGSDYLRKFGFKFLISAQGKKASEILEQLENRMNQSLEQELDTARLALWEITAKRLQVLSEKSLSAKITNLLEKQGIPGAMVSLSERSRSVQTLCFGSRNGASPSSGEPVTQDTWFQLASLSKTLGACLALECFRTHSIALSTSVNALLKDLGSDFRLSSDWVEVTHLLNHQALNLHYVNGIPLNERMPNASELLSGNSRYGYPPIEVKNEPGTAFQYSGGGFIVLEHLLELLEKKPIQELGDAFLKSLGLSSLSFEQKNLSHTEYANENSRKMFPALAAGASGTASAYLNFLKMLGSAFRLPEKTNSIAHETAVRMLSTKDAASQKFMGVLIGLGVFVAEAGLNRFAIHQGANDGFRALSLYCFSGPDQGTGFVILCNADEAGVQFIAETAAQIFRELKLEGVDLNAFKTNVELKDITAEERVNLGYKELIFAAFTPDLPEAIFTKGPKDDYAAYNALVEAEIVEVSNQGFARAENLIAPNLPTFDPELYGRQGKVMDSWETIRHNFKPKVDPRDFATFKLKKPSKIQYVMFSTQYHLGNHAPAVSLEGLGIESGEWELLLPKMRLEGHSQIKISLAERNALYSQVRVSMFPDGGLTRVGIYDETLPENAKKSFQPPAEAKCVMFSPPIPQPKKPLTPKFQNTPEAVEKNWNSVIAGNEVDVANAAWGGRVISASNEHYGPAAQVISPYPPLNMFDGAESARSREPLHSEEIILGLGRPAVLHRIEIDFTYFKNNNPNELIIEARVGGAWKPLVPKTLVKPFAGNSIHFAVDSCDFVEQIKLTLFPDGGMNRVRAFTRA